ncbi:MAG: protein phosphatase 2C domain-containing protein [Anaerolineae bacterium]|nr:protein phosphatase 2C domain-containing protein [Anaerolineae bacterium]
MSQPSAAPLVVSVAMHTDVGKQREQNQDAIGHLIPEDPVVLGRLGQLFVLADADESLARSDLASQYAVSTILSSYYEQEQGAPPERLARAIAEANNVIYAESQESNAEMAATVIGAVIRGHDLILGTVGDSPVYLVRDGEPRRLTPELPTRELLSEGALGEEGEPVLALGVSHSAQVDIITGRVRAGDTVLLCSDSLARYVTPPEMAQTVIDLPAEQAAETLVALANERNGTSDVSVIVLCLSQDDDLASLPRIPDPMEAWGVPRRSERARSAETSASGGWASSAQAAASLLSAVYRLLRGNTVLTGASMAVALVLFVLLMLAISSLGGDEKTTPKATPIPPAVLTQTVTVGQQRTAQAIAQATNEAALAATSAEAARLTLTPPTPVPTSGPQMEAGLWFKVLPGDPIPAFDAPSLRAERLTDLEPGSNYRVSSVNRQADAGPWYQVIDNLGEEIRWANGPSLHARIVVVNEAGDPLPAEAQPLDVPPPGAEGAPAPTRTPAETATPRPTQSGTPGTPAAPPLTPTSTTRPSISYGVETWEVGTMVALKTDLNLCRIPDVLACDSGSASEGEIGTIVQGPIPAGEHWWWEVEFQDGRAGWVAQVLLGIP